MCVRGNEGRSTRFLTRRLYSVSFPSIYFSPSSLPPFFPSLLLPRNDKDRDIRRVRKAHSRRHGLRRQVQLSLQEGSHQLRRQSGKGGQRGHRERGDAGEEGEGRGEEAEEILLTFKTFKMVDRCRYLVVDRQQKDSCSYYLVFRLCCNFLVARVRVPCNLTGHFQAFPISRSRLFPPSGALSPCISTPQT